MYYLNMSQKNKIYTIFLLIAIFLVGASCQKSKTVSNTNSPVENNNAVVDSDGDGLLDIKELEIGTNPNVADSDGDGYSDSEEVANGFDPGGPGRAVSCDRLVLPVIGAALEKGDAIDNCYYRAAIDKRSESFCDKVDKNNFFYPNCFMGVAILKNDKSICNKLTEIGREDKAAECKKYVDAISSAGGCPVGDVSCNRNVAYATLETAYCKKISDSYSQNLCLNRVLEIKPVDAQLCDSLRDNFSKDSCYSSLGAENRDIKFCDNVTDARKSECLINVAVVAHDESICSVFTDEYYRNSCYLRFPNRDNLAEQYLITQNIGDYKFGEVYQFNQKILKDGQTARFKATYSNLNVPADAFDYGDKVFNQTYHSIQILLDLFVFESPTVAQDNFKKTYLDRFPQYIVPEEVAGKKIYTSGASGGVNWVSGNVYVSISADKYLTEDQQAGIAYVEDIIPLVEAYLSKYPPPD